MISLQSFDVEQRRERECDGFTQRLRELLGDSGPQVVESQDDDPQSAASQDDDPESGESRGDEPHLAETQEDDTTVDTPDRMGPVDVETASLQARLI